MRKSRSLLIAPLSVLCVAAVVGCGSSSSSSSSSSASTSAPTATSAAPGASGANAAVAALIPSAIKSKGTITVASDASYAPNEFIAPDGHTVIGMDADLVKALAALMGLKASVINVPFASIIPGLMAGKYDMEVSSSTDTKVREKSLDFVDYYTAGESFYTKTQGGTSIASIADLCGHTVAVETATTEKDDANTQSAKCKKAGKPAVSIFVFPDQNGANLAVSSGRAQLGFADTPVALYQVKKTGGQFKLVGAEYANKPYGLGFPKSSGLAKAMLAALEVLMKDGAYTSILTHWGIQAGAITKPTINGATS